MAGSRPRRAGSARRKSLGQNFLRNLAAADRIVELFAPSPGEVVLEVGPGEGVLTERLLDRGAVVVAIERDTDLAEATARRLGGKPGLHMHLGDARRLPLDPLLLPHVPAGGRARVLSNLPYSAGTEILVRLLRHRAILAGIMVMLQREVADRICAPPGSRVYGSISVLAQYFTEPRRLMTLEPGSFAPPPRVRSAVVSLPFRPTLELSVESESRYGGFIHAAFHSRRRTLPHNLAPAWNCGAPEAARRIEEAGIDPRRRPESLDRSEFLILFKAGPAGV